MRDCERMTLSVNLGILPRIAVFPEIGVIVETLGPNTVSLPRNGTRDNASTRDKHSTLYWLIYAILLHFIL